MEMLNANHIDHTAFYKKINFQLLCILLLMVACFFTWSENVVITRGIKVV
ncbi:MAG: exopolysaccharide production protein ExoQ, partial [Marivirga sp.]